MDLPADRVKKTYIHAVNLVCADIQSAVDNDTVAAEASRIQEKLDALASRYQDVESLGALRYKLYEAQALLYYFLHDDDRARAFIHQAIDSRGESYPKAERLLAKLGDNAAAPAARTGKLYKGKSLVGIEGWLALFVVGLGITALIELFSFFGSVSVFTDLGTIRGSLPDLASSLEPLLWFELITTLAIITLAIYTIVQLARRKRFAKKVAIIYMITLLAVAVIDGLWGSAVMSSYSSIDFSSETTDSSTAFGRNLFYCLIWIPYFLVSKRVKATLTK